MGDHGLRNIAGEVFIYCRWRVYRQQSDALLDGSALRERQVQHRNGQRAIFDDNLGAGTHVGQQRAEVPRGPRLPRCGWWPYAR